eukprot:TRINITY_DN70901_c0_g1_i1.p1 TRINITY_DN70901_c0_g1~~TRINITY_DN70901_c0_g1_i1.p1  ORF type:complete len:104 (-),score=14.47 TRINITY_DN70901_c0_g1_i1:138-449(-)
MLLKDLEVSLCTPPVLWCDNIGAIQLATNPVFYARTKHIEVDYHFIKEKVMHKDLELRYVATIDQIADIFTKGFSTVRFGELKSKLSIDAPTSSLKGRVTETT